MDWFRHLAALVYYLCFVFVAFFMCSVEFVPGNVEKVVKTDDKPIFLVLNTRKIGLLGLL